MQERSTIPVSFDGVECQVPWTTGYNYINPTFCDLDGDGDQDLIFGGDWARVSFFRNNGTSDEPLLGFESDSLVSLPETYPGSQLSNRPAFCDIDNDGDYDLFVGTYLNWPIAYGRLLYYKNIGTYQYPQFELEEEFYQGIDYHNEQYATFVDIDNDGDYDMFIGLGHHWNPTDGQIAYYENIGTPEEAIMDSITSCFLGINLVDWAIPSFIDIDNDGDYDMFLGDEDGKIHYYRNDGTPEVYDFIFVTDEYADVNVANIASPTFTDIDGDGDFDLFVGERSWGQDDRRGDINFYENTGSPDSAVFELVTQNFLSIDIGKHPPPAFADIDNDNLLDMFIGDSEGNINYFSNTGSENDPYFTFVTETFEDIAAEFQSRPTFGDLDGDGDNDMIVGRTGGSNSIQLYRNDGTVDDPEYTLIDNQYLGIDYQRPAPRLVDIDNDNDLDLFVGHWWNQVVYWNNQGTIYQPNFVLENSNFLNTTYDGDFCPITFGDLDGDGDYDLIRGSVYTELTYYRNDGSPESPNMVLAEEGFCGIELVHTPEPCLIDIDTDGDLDLFVGDFCGGVSFWRNNEVSVVNGRPEAGPYTFTLHQNYPNPFNAQTVIPFSMDRAGKVSLNIYDITGRSVGVQYIEPLQGGMHEFVWNAEGMASGVYLVRLTVDGKSQGAETRQPGLVRKVILLK